MRNTLLGSANPPTSPAAGTFMSALPSDLRSVMKSCTKYTNNASRSNSPSSVTATIEYLWLLSECETVGATSARFSNSTEPKYQQIYQYYRKSGYPGVFREHTSPAPTREWWLRSTYHALAGYFASIDRGGRSTSTPSGKSLGVAPAFCV